ncbi:16024_t:CDS:1, partial [Funneliformis mosseae]
QGNGAAQFSLGHCYKYGIGTDKNVKESFSWYLKSAEGGYKLAYLPVGDCYLHGKGVKQNTDKAWVWYQKATT